jgi:polysaccharide deacetylase family protein (PEP-CTERM system associated)
MQRTSINALTIDVEDYFHVTGFERQIPRRSWSSYESRFEYGLHRILETIHARGIKATFYVLGWLARRYPRLMREIDACGHELGSHSYWHRQVFRLSPRTFRSDLCRSRRVIEDAVGKPVTTYRAPSFSITKSSLWALEILAEEGFVSDSSIMPCVHDRYGISDAVPDVHRIITPAGPLWELPPAVLRWGPLKVPAGGGGYFRLYPLAWTAALLRSISRRQQSFTFYVHPWEFDPDQPRVTAGSRLGRARHYLNLHDTHRKFARLLRLFPFGRVSDVIATMQKAAHASQEVSYAAG